MRETKDDVKNIRKVDEREEESKIKHTESFAKPGEDFDEILMNSMNSDIFGIIKECGVNGFDALAKNIRIEFNAKTRTYRLRVDDDGHGILDPHQFTIFMTHAKERAGQKTGRADIAGRYGSARAEFLNIAKTVTFYSNNGRFGCRIEMHKEIVNGYEKIKFDISESPNPQEFREEIGTTVEFENLDLKGLSKDEFEDQLWTRMTDYFGWKVAKGYTVKVSFPHRSATHEDPITVLPTDFLPEHTLAEFQDRKGNKHAVTGKLVKGDGKGGVGDGHVRYYCKHYLVNRRQLIDTDHDFSGVVNCDTVTPLIGRHEFKENEIYLQSIKGLKKRVKDFPRKRVEVNSKMHKASDSLEKVMDKFLLSKGITLTDKGIGHQGKPKGREVGSGGGKEQGIVIEEIEKRYPGDTHGTHTATGEGPERKNFEETHEVEREGDHQEIKQPARTESGLIVEFRELGQEEQLPIKLDTVKMNLVFVNTQHPIVLDFVLKDITINNPHLGDIQVRMYSLVAMLLTEIVIRAQSLALEFEDQKRLYFEALQFLTQELR